MMDVLKLLYIEPPRRKLRCSSNPTLMMDEFLSLKSKVHAQVRVYSFLLRVGSFKIGRTRHTVIG